MEYQHRLCIVQQFGWFIKYKTAIENYPPIRWLRYKTWGADEMLDIVSSVKDIQGLAGIVFDNEQKVYKESDATDVEVVCKATNTLHALHLLDRQRLSNY